MWAKRWACRSTASTRSPRRRRHARAAKLAERLPRGGLDPRSQVGRQLLYFVEEISRLPAALGAARRRDGDHPGAAVRTGADRKRLDGRAAPSSSGTKTISMSSAF